MYCTVHRVSLSSREICTKSTQCISNVCNFVLNFSLCSKPPLRKKSLFCVVRFKMSSSISLDCTNVHSNWTAFIRLRWYRRVRCRFCQPQFILVLLVITVLVMWTLWEREEWRWFNLTWIWLLKSCLLALISLHFKYYSSITYRISENSYSKSTIILVSDNFRRFARILHTFLACTRFSYILLPQI